MGYTLRHECHIWLFDQQRTKKEIAILSDFKYIYFYLNIEQCNEIK